MGGNNKAKGNQETLTHSVMSDVCTGVMEMSSAGGSALDFRLIGKMWSRLQKPTICSRRSRRQLHHQLK